MSSKLLLSIAGSFILGVATSFAGSEKCKECPSKSKKYANAKMKAAGPDIVDTAVAAGSFKTLVAAVKAAGLVDLLKGDGPYTVFAPTDDAFAKLPAGTVESLLKPENKHKLKAILTYHVVPGQVTAEQVVRLRKAATAQGSDIAIGVNGNAVTVNNANVIKTDIMTSNGVIHVIDAVILPPEGNDNAS